MKALSIQPLYAALILGGLKPFEIRHCRTNYRGPILICTTVTPTWPFLAGGMAVAIADVVGCRPFRTRDVAAAHCDFRPGHFAWELARVQEIVPFKVRGMPGLFEVDMGPAATSPASA